MPFSRMLPHEPEIIDTAAVLKYCTIPPNCQLHVLYVPKIGRHGVVRNPTSCTHFWQLFLVCTQFVIAVFVVLVDLRVPV